MVEAKWVQILFVVLISLEVLAWCVVGEEEEIYKPTDGVEKDGGKWSRGIGTGNTAWGGFPDYGGGPGGGGPTHCGVDSGCGNGGGGGGGYVYENGGGNCESNGNIGGAGGGGGVGYGVGIGVGGGGGGGYGIGVGTGNGVGVGSGGGVGGGGGCGVGIGGGRVVGNGGGGGVGVGGSGGGLGVGGGGGESGGFVIPGVSGQPFFCFPLSCTNGPCNRLALYWGIQPVYENGHHTSTHENNGHDRSNQTVAPGPASEVDGEGRSSNDQSLEGPTRGINGEDAEHDAFHQEQIPYAVSPASR